MIDRQAPQNLEAEKALIGAVLLDNAAFDKVAAIVSPADFYHGLHGKLFQAMGELISDGKAANVVTLSAKTGIDAGLIIDLGMGVPTAANAAHFADLVAKKATSRALIAAATEIIESAHGQSDANDQLAQAERRVLEISQSRNRTGAPLQFGDLVLKAAQESQNRPGELPGIPTGSRGLDAKIYGFIPGKFHVIAGLPGEGKTAKLLTHAYAAASKGTPTHVFELEMSGDEVGIRGAASLANVDSYRLFTGRLSDIDLVNLQAAVGRAYVPLTVDEDIYDFDRVLSRSRFLARQGVKFFLYDYLLLFEGGGRFERDDLRIAHYARQLKAFAKQCTVAVVALTQFKGQEERYKQPHAGDLYGSTFIRNTADVIELIYNPIKARVFEPLLDADGREITGLMAGDIVKCRHGKTGRVLYYFDRPTTTYSDWPGPEPIKRRGE